MDPNCEKIDNLSGFEVYQYRGIAKKELENLKGARADWEKAAESGDEYVIELLKEYCEWLINLLKT